MGEYAYVRAAGTGLAGDPDLVWDGSPVAAGLADRELSGGLNTLHGLGWDLVCATTSGGPGPVAYHLFLHRGTRENEQQG